MTTHDILIDNFDTLADGVLEPGTRNFRGAYDDIRAAFGIDLDNEHMNLLAIIIRLADMGEEVVSVKQLKARPVNAGTLPADIDEGLRQLKQVGFILMIDIIDDGDGDMGVLLPNRFPCE